ncbi:MAG: hypothetical protein ABIK15_20925 [Pseudomonadota bacterium]
MRIRYRNALIRSVQVIVRSRRPPSAKNIQQLTNELELVSENNKEAFNKMVLNDQQRMHEGNIARYRLKLSEFQSWKPIRDRYNGHQ